MLHYYTADGTYVGYAKWKHGRWTSYTRDGRVFGMPRAFVAAAQADAIRFFECGVRVLKG